jgi:hypothetical protein
MNKKSNPGSIMIPNLKVYYRPTVINRAWYWHKNRQEDQWVRIKDLDISPHIYIQLIFHKGAQNT